MRQAELLLNIGFAVEAVRETAPVVQCIAPREATAFVADVLYAAGARPVVTGTSPEALAALASADALALDLGTLGLEGSEGLTSTLAQAHGGHLKWVLDASRLGRAGVRQERLQNLVGLHPAVLRVEREDLAELRLSGHDGALVVSGDTESVSHGDRLLQVEPGAPQLRRIAGVRAAVAALTAACATVADPLVAAIAGAAWLSEASQRAVQNSSGPASFRVALVDALAEVRGDEVAEALMNA